MCPGEVGPELDIGRIVGIWIRKELKGKSLPRGGTGISKSAEDGKLTLKDPLLYWALDGVSSFIYLFSVSVGSLWWRVMDKPFSD